MGGPPDAPRAGARHRWPMTTISHTPLPAALRAAGFVGRLVEPDDDDYDTARAGSLRSSEPAVLVYAREN